MAVKKREAIFFTVNDFYWLYLLYVAHELLRVYAWLCVPEAEYCMQQSDIEKVILTTQLGRLGYHRQG